MTSNFTPNLWFDGNAMDAAEFYVSIFPNSRIGDVTRFTESNVHGETGNIMTVDWYLDGNKFTGINGGSQFPFTPAISIMYECDTQDEIDRYWAKLIEDGGKPIECGWLEDKFGLSWQISPRILNKMLVEGTEKQQDAVAAVFLKMKKLEIAPIVAAYEAAA
jgi:predicted 3-demethylubiquinone-9 3-methyltransferase (glyoxalase superfamily)